ncbi:MAG: Zn-ribbon domain-containing OB-fold protein [Thermodesulfobacteriota bacterium]
MSARPFNDFSYEQFLKEGKIMGSLCQKCGAKALPPRPICISCYGTQMEWIEFKGEGKLAAFTDIVVAPPFMAKEGYGKNNPYVVGVVELKEGVKIVARLTGINALKPEEIKVGRPLKGEIVEGGSEGEKKVYLTFKAI